MCSLACRLGCVARCCRWLRCLAQALRELCKPRVVGLSCLLQSGQAGAVKARCSRRAGAARKGLRGSKLALEAQKLGSERVVPGAE